MEEAYAQALWQKVEGGMPPKKAVELLHALLVSQGREALMPRIGKALERLAAKKREAEGITLSVAREKDTRAAVQEAKELIASLGAGEAEAEIVVDESLIGGWRLEGREHLYDRSFKKQLLSLYNRATQ